MIAFQKNKNGFSKRWIDYCEKNQISYKLVDFYDTNIIEQLRECSAVMWHFSHMGSKDFLMAKPLLYGLHESGKKIFPDFNTMWHFDDKVGQKYMFEALGMPLVKTWVFYDSASANNWIKTTQFPKVFKLRGGAGSVNVKLILTKRKAKKIIKRAFGIGFKNTSVIPFKEILHKYRMGKFSRTDLIKSFARIFIPTKFSRISGKERGYAYFQDFIPNLDCDYRLIVIDKKTLGIKRSVRDNDFRASGSGKLSYDRSLFPIEMLKLANELSIKLKLQSAAFDFVIYNGAIKLIEVSYGFPSENFADNCPGYWDENLIWQKGKFNPYGWMVDSVINSTNG